MNTINSQVNYDEFFSFIADEEWWIASQPIVNIKDHIQIAKELLIRVGKEGSVLDNSKFFPEITLDPRFLEVSSNIWALIKKNIENNSNIFSEKTFINICPKDIENEKLVSKIKDVNSKFLSCEKRIVLELSEQFSEMELTNSNDIFIDLFNLGIEFAVDDYGLGVLDLDLIKRTKASFLKFDKSICIEDFAKNQDLIKQALLFCRDNNITSIAEGVETVEQKDILLNEGFALAQGFLFEEPKQIFSA